MFFQSWELWEKMSFILGAALITVFMFGWAKLAWKIRLMKKQDVVDEEKRARKQELRACSQRGEARGKHEIPFGVRALQSGIQVDGIWISNPNTPVPSELTLSSIRGESSDDLAKRSPKPLTKVVPQPRSKPSIRARPDSFGCYRAKSETLQDIVEGRATRSSYKPRRSSLLRNGGQRDEIEDSSDCFEGTTISRKKTMSPRSRSYPLTDRDPDSSAADNERNSGTSEESDATLSLEPSLKDNRFCISNSSVTVDDNTEKTLLNDSPSLPGQPLEKIHNSNIEINTAINDRSEDEISCFLRPLELNENRDQETKNFKMEPSRIQSPNPFKPGEIHMNKTSRKVNTGFEVLPAGTFGTPAEFNTNFIDPEENRDSTIKRPAKLHKKPPDLLSQYTGIIEEGS